MMCVQTGPGVVVVAFVMPALTHASAVVVAPRRHIRRIVARSLAAVADWSRHIGLFLAVDALDNELCYCERNVGCYIVAKTIDDVGGKRVMAMTFDAPRQAFFQPDPDRL